MVPMDVVAAFVVGVLIISIAVCIRCMVGPTEDYLPRAEDRAKNRTGIPPLGTPYPNDDDGMADPIMTGMLFQQMLDDATSCNDCCSTDPASIDVSFDSVDCGDCGGGDCGGGD